MTKKRKVSLDIFEESVLPGLQEKHATAADLQKSIDEGYEIYEENDAGEKTAITYKVSGKAASNKPADDPDLIVKTVETAMKGFTDSLKPALDKIAGIAIPDDANIKLTSRAIPEGLKLYRPVKSFDGRDNDDRNFKAFRFGAWMLGGVFGQKKYADWCHEHGVPIVRASDDAKATITIGKAQAEGINTAGGILVPDVVENDIIVLREKYGVFRANSRVRPMTRDNLTVPRRTSGVTAYFTSENTAITESQKAWDGVQLFAKKLAALTRYSTEILEDAIISVADDLADEIVYAFSLKEDQCGFTGDGTSTYGGIVGVSNAITTNWTSTTADAAGSVIATGNLMTEVTDGDLLQVIGNCPQYADDGTAAWYCSRVAAFSVFGRLLRALGGVTISEGGGALPQSYAGYPIKVTQVMPTTDTNSQIIAFFGSLKKASCFGDRRQTTIAISDQRYFDSDQVGIRGTERFDIVVHDVGDGTTVGPIVGLRAAAS